MLRGGVLDPLCEALEAQEEAPHSKQHTGHSMAQRAIRGVRTHTHKHTEAPLHLECGFSAVLTVCCAVVCS